MALQKFLLCPVLITIPSSTFEETTLLAILFSLTIYVWIPKQYSFAIRGIIVYIFFRDMLPLNIMFVSFMHVVACNCSSFIFITV